MEDAALAEVGTDAQQKSEQEEEEELPAPQQGQNKHEEEEEEAKRQQQQQKEEEGEQWSVSEMIASSASAVKDVLLSTVAEKGDDTSPETGGLAETVKNVMDSSAQLVEDAAASVPESEEVSILINCIVRD